MTRSLHSATLGVLALMLSATFALPLHAQDRADQRRDQPTPDQSQSDDRRAQPDERRTQPDERRAQPDEGRPQADERRVQPDEQRPQPDERRAPEQSHRDARPEERRGASDDVDTLRHEHPRAAARCHDGFFTNTRERGRACSKHGGIDIWLAL